MYVRTNNVGDNGPELASLHGHGSAPLDGPTRLILWVIDAADVVRLDLPLLEIAERPAGALVLDLGVRQLLGHRSGGPRSLVSLSQMSTSTANSRSPFVYDTGKPASSPRFSGRITRAPASACKSSSNLRFAFALVALGFVGVGTCAASQSYARRPVVGGLDVERTRTMCVDAWSRSRASCECARSTTARVSSSVPPRGEGKNAISGFRSPFFPRKRWRKWHFSYETSPHAARHQRAHT